MNKHKAILKANEYRKLYSYYELGWIACPFITEYKGQVVGNHVVWEGFMNSPLLKVGETVLVQDLEEEVSVLSVTRSTDGSVIYQTDYEFDMIEDEETIASKEKAEKEKEAYENRAVEVPQQEQPKEVKKTWWQRLFNQ